MRLLPITILQCWNAGVKILKSTRFWSKPTVKMIFYLGILTTQVSYFTGLEVTDMVSPHFIALSGSSIFAIMTSVSSYGYNGYHLYQHHNHRKPLNNHKIFFYLFHANAVHLYLSWANLGEPNLDCPSLAYID